MFESEATKNELNREIRIQFSIWIFQINETACHVISIMSYGFVKYEFICRKNDNVSFSLFQLKVCTIFYIQKSVQKSFIFFYV